MKSEARDIEGKCQEIVRGPKMCGKPGVIELRNWKGCPGARPFP